jgi:hypothetical protein
MTNQKHLKSRVRDRMARTGERYAAARANVVGAAPNSPAGVATDSHPTAPFHLPGIHPESTAIRVLAAAAGVTDPGTGAAPTEDLAFVIAGGIGAGAFTFRYPEFSSLYLAGQNRFDANLAFIQDGLERLGLNVDVLETSGVVAARRNLEAALASGPAIAWVDAVELGTRAIPPAASGGGYHVVTVHEIDPADGTVTIGDLRAAPERISGDRFAAARRRIAKDRNRVVVLRGATDTDLDAAVRAGLATTVRGLRHPRTKSFGLEAFSRLADRMVTTTGADAWATVYPRGERLWEALRSVFEHVELSGTGGGLLRPMFARGLDEAARLTSDTRLVELARRYRAIGEAWSALAQAALPEDVAELRAAREAMVERLGRFEAGAEPYALEPFWARLDELRRAAETQFPMPATAVDLLLADLSDRLRGIVKEEATALAELEAVVDG